MGQIASIRALLTWESSNELPITEEIPWPHIPLNDDLYFLGEEHIKFLKAQSGIKDDEALKAHILTVQQEAYHNVHPYPCIRRFQFVKYKITQYPAYRDLLALGKTRSGALFLDIGCCAGTDIRKVVADGYPHSQVIASDIRPEFWELGHKLFRSNTRTFPVAFIPGDALDPSFLDVAPPSTSPQTPLPPLPTLTSLSPLHGRLSAIHASSVFHLFDEAKQLTLARGLASLLSSEPGSIIFGAHSARPEKGVRVEALAPDSQHVPIFSHGPESWKDLWEKEVFSEGQVRVWVELKEVERPDMQHWDISKFWVLVWSVTRL